MSDNHEQSYIVTLGETVFNLMALNVLWVLFTLPVVTIGVSTTAMNYTCIKLRRDEGEGLIHSFFSSLKLNFKQALFMGTAMVAVLIIILACLIQATGMIVAESSGGTALLLLCVVLLYVWFILFAYLFFLQARFDNPIKRTVVNAVYFILTDFPTALKVGFIELFLLFLLPVFLWLFLPYGFPLVIFMGVPLTAYILSSIFNRIFEDYIEEPSEEFE